MSGSRVGRPDAESTCAHRGERLHSETGQPFSFRCAECGVEICTDCGSAPVHEDSLSHYCRSCGEKAGDRYRYFTPIDHDALRAKVGRELAAEILRDCREPWA